MEIFYQSFLLRIWKSKTQNYDNWHASLEDPVTHQIITFNHPDDLFEYLRHICNFNELKNGKEKSK